MDELELINSVSLSVIGLAISCLMDRQRAQPNPAVTSRLQGISNFVKEITIPLSLPYPDTGLRRTGAAYNLFLARERQEPITPDLGKTFQSLFETPKRPKSPPIRRIVDITDESTEKTIHIPTTPDQTDPSSVLTVLTETFPSNASQPIEGSSEQGENPPQASSNQVGSQHLEVPRNMPENQSHLPVPGPEPEQSQNQSQPSTEVDLNWPRMIEDVLKNYSEQLVQRGDFQQVRHLAEQHQTKIMKLHIGILRQVFESHEQLAATILTTMIFMLSGRSSYLARKCVEEVDELRRLATHLPQDLQRTFDNVFHSRNFWQRLEDVIPGAMREREAQYFPLRDEQRLNKTI